ncbi:MAG TPA: hypothetical protein VF733_03235 [Candidatus Saccharimonadales bacterium]
MKKNFSQPFEKGVTTYELILQHAVTNKFLLFESTIPYYEEGWHRSFRVEVAKDEQVAQSVGRYLYQKGLILNSYRELTRYYEVEFSFADNSPGSQKTRACLLVVIDMPDTTKLDTSDEKAVFVDVDELRERFLTSPEVGQAAWLGLVQLLVEAKELGLSTADTV